MPPLRTHPHTHQVAIDNEVLMAVSNINYAWPGGMLNTWLDNANRAGVKVCVEGGGGGAKVRWVV